jgi:rhamnogalacturonyl hydrolase YesR
MHELNRYSILIRAFHFFGFFKSDFQISYVINRSLTKAVISFLNSSCVWCQLMDKYKLEANYLETSGSAMLAALELNR